MSSGRRPDHASVILVLAVVLYLIGAVMASCGERARPLEEGEPRVTLKIWPPVAPAPAVIIATVMVGGPEVEELYCLELEVLWGDGMRSWRDFGSRMCEPFPDRTEYRRCYQTSSRGGHEGAHLYREEGTYTIVARLKRGDRTIREISGRVLVGAPGNVEAE